MTHKIRMLALVLLALALTMAGIGGAVAAHAAPTPASLAQAPTTSSGTYNYGTLAIGTTKSVTFTLTNTGGKATGPLTITQSGSSAFTIIQDGCTGRSPGPNKSCTDTVEYAPKSSGQSPSATLTASGKGARASLTLNGQAGVGGTTNLTLSPGRLLETENGTKVYGYLQPSSIHATTFTVTNSGTSSSFPLLIKCNREDNSESCPYPFTLTHDTCTTTSLAANGGSCTIDLEVTLDNNCQEGSQYHTYLEVVDNETTDIILEVTAVCPG